MEKIINEIVGIKKADLQNQHLLDLEKQGNEIYEKDPRRYDAAKKTQDIMFAFIRAYQDILPEMNKHKLEIDKAYKEKDVEKFEEHLKEFRQIVVSVMDLKAKLKSRRKMRRFKIQTPLFEETLRKIQFLEDTVESGEKWLKRQRMSPARQDAAEKARERMQRLWGAS